MKAGWEVKPLGEVLEVQNGYAFASKQFSESEGTPIIRIRDITAGTTTKRFVGPFNEDYVVKNGDYLIGMDGEFRCNQWQGDDALLNQRVCRLREFSDALLPRYLYYGVNKYLKDIEDVTSFTTVKHLSSKSIKAIEFPIPPLEEQKRIVAVLDAAFEGLTRAKENAEANLQNARELFEATVTALLSNPSGEWERAKLTEYCEKITVGHVGPMASKYVDQGVPFLRSQNVRPYRIDLENVKYIDQGFHGELAKSKLSPGDVAIVRTGYPGTSAVIPDDLLDANCADLVIAKTGPKLDAHFLALLLNSDYGKKLVAGAAVGAAQKHFNVGAAKEALFDFPPLFEQRALVEKLEVARSQLSELENFGATKLTDIADLRQSLLQKAFAGELT
ncbi:type I restriction enzyme, S subunit [Cognatiyoonia koreensis]|uniref:Type I restriction enzyme, S subunit n=1 Tax=Cognatiyoonia koreensis TaxID=364200 RepID=A0A1I0QYF6_9RHOB|nr:restriction endonuclease subunit S [Cognatiyoonia koreensis]SEW32904.1 type I restriction enzyme, S subunit [Cognatiyoonia koreensis]